MSPLALFYILFASSPLLNNWRHESTSPSTWNAMPFEHESFEHYTPSIWGEESTYEPEHLNWLLRKAVRSTEERYPTSIRSIISEMTGRRFFNEEPRMFENVESVSPIVRLIKRVAEVNPIMIEKILSCPITLRKVEKVLRNVEPETLRMVEKMIKKSLPVNIREKVVRRVLKTLLTKSSVFGRRSIVSEMYPTEESLFSTRRHFSEESMIKNLIEKLFSTRRHMNVESELYSTESSIFGKHSFEHKQIKNLIKKVLRNAEVSPVEELFSTRTFPESKMIKKIVKSVLRNAEVSPVEELFSTRTFPESKMIKKIVKSILRNAEVSPVEESKMVKKIVKIVKNIRRHAEVSPVEKLFSTRRSFPESKMVKKIVKLVKNIKNTENVNTECPEEFFCNYVCESNTHMRPEFMNMCEEVCHNYESSWESPVFGKHFGAKKITKLIKKLSKEQF